MCNNLTLITSLNKNLIPENVPKIKYEQVEVFWKSKYGKQQPKKKQPSELAYSTDIGKGFQATIKSIEFKQKGALKDMV